MKKVLCLLSLVMGLGAGFSVQAKISSGAFNSVEPMTSGKIFLNQVDAVSLYLTTERIVYVPRLTEEMDLNVSMILVNMPADADRKELQAFATRHMTTFNKVLMERLKFHVPQLAKEFDPNKDIEFVIKVSADKTVVATVKEGNWNWVKETAAAAAVTAPSIVSAPLEEEAATPCKKKCPAMTGTSPAKETAAAQPMPQEIPAKPQASAPQQEAEKQAWQMTIDEKASAPVQTSRGL